jgi:hypothetical protein
LSQRFKQRELVIIQFRKSYALRIAIELFVLLLVSHFKEFTLRALQSSRNESLDRGIYVPP